MAVPNDLQSYFAGAARQRQAYQEQRGSRFLNGLGDFGKSALGGVFNLAASAFNHHLAEKSAKAQYDRQLDFWNKQNAYNSPLAQRKRLEQAGLNPAVLGSQIAGSNTAGSLSSVPGNDVAQRGAVDHSSFLNSLQLLGQMESVGAGTDSMKRQIELSYADELIKNNQAYGIELDNREKNELLKWVSSEKRASLESLLSGTAHTNALTEGVSIDNSNKQLQYDDAHEAHKASMDIYREQISSLRRANKIGDQYDELLVDIDLQLKRFESDLLSNSVEISKVNNYSRRTLGVDLDKVNPVYLPFLLPIIYDDMNGLLSDDAWNNLIKLKNGLLGSEMQNHINSSNPDYVSSSQKFDYYLRSVGLDNQTLYNQWYMLLEDARFDQEVISNIGDLLKIIKSDDKDYSSKKSKK